MTNSQREAGIARILDRVIQPTGKCACGAPAAYAAYHGTVCTSCSERNRKAANADTAAVVARLRAQREAA